MYLDTFTIKFYICANHAILSQLLLSAQTNEVMIYNYFKVTFYLNNIDRIIERKSTKQTGKAAYIFPLLYQYVS